MTKIQNIRKRVAHLVKMAQDDVKPNPSTSMWETSLPWYIGGIAPGAYGAYGLFDLGRRGWQYGRVKKDLARQGTYFGGKSQGGPVVGPVDVNSTDPRDIYAANVQRNNMSQKEPKGARSRARHDVTQAYTDYYSATGDVPDPLVTPPASTAPRNAAGLDDPGMRAVRILSGQSDELPAALRPIVDKQVRGMPLSRAEQRQLALYTAATMLTGTDNGRPYRVPLQTALDRAHDTLKTRRPVVEGQPGNYSIEADPVRARNSADAAIGARRAAIRNGETAIPGMRGSIPAIALRTALGLGGAAAAGYVGSRQERPVGQDLKADDLAALQSIVDMGNTNAPAIPSK